MKNRKKVIAAVIGGVNAYIAEQESTLHAKERRPCFTPNFWGMNGRQEMMQAKRMWQMRWFKK